MVNQRQSVEELFCAALDLPTGERQAYLDAACRDTPELRLLVEELLAEEQRAGSFLEVPLLRAGVAASGLTATLELSKTTCDLPASLPERSAPRFAPMEVIAERFVVVRFLARGGMGEVYEVEDRLLQGEHVALKIIRPEIAEEAGSTLRFEQEVLLARKVHHPNLCPIYEIFRCERPEPTFLFLTMKLLSGETLDEQLRRGRIVVRQEAVDVCTKLIAGVAAMHAAGIIHRDIKPKNVMLERKGDRIGVFLLDFGLARLHETEATVHKTGLVAGTPGYLAPELLQGLRPTRATDLFALGVVLHQVLTGMAPLDAANGKSVLPARALQSAAAPAYLLEAVQEFLSDDPERRCRAFKAVRTPHRLRASTAAAPASEPQRFTRRRFAAAAAAASICMIGGGAAWQRNQIYDLLHPLPRKRFVALLDWPPPADAEMRPMILSLIDAIGNELSRAEAFDRDLFVTAPTVTTELTSIAQLNQVRESLGANLVLAASGRTDADLMHVTLHVLDLVTGQTLRSKELSTSVKEQMSLPQRTVRAAAELLDVRRYEPNDGRLRAGTDHPRAQAAFQSAEALMKRDNDAGLEQAIGKYREAVEQDPQYAIAYAKLAQAYGRSYAITRDTGALHLARANCDHALALDAAMVEAHLARAFVFRENGEEQEALVELTRTLALDPANPTTLLWLARLYTRMNRWPDAERTFHRVLEERPNLWLTYNELGFGLHGQGRWKDAVEAFRTATVAAPGSAMAASNLGVEYLQIGEFAEATKSLRRSLTLQPDSDGAAANTSLSLRYQGRYEEALPFALKSTELNSGEDANWLELGDCYSSIPHRQAEAKMAYSRAAVEAERHLRTDSTNGPEWMLLALYRLKSGTTQNVESYLAKAETLGAEDMDSQIYKVRVLELMGRREEALVTLEGCFKRGATPLQIEPFPDLVELRTDERYRNLQPGGEVNSKALID